MTASTLPTYFISHGGGPWPWMQAQRDGPYRALAAALGQIPRDLGAAPAAVLMISAHWEEPAFTVMGAAAPPMLYDYGGFPAHTYEISYPAPGSPVLAERVQRLLKDAGIANGRDDQRGFDHGMFAPMAVIFPEANVPVVQLSLKRGLDPAEHLALGRALTSLRHEGVLIVGSGLSYHNLRAFGPGAKAPSAAFDGWLQRVLIGEPPAQRTTALLHWEAAPAARQAHPREEHLLPLMVVVGAAESERATLAYHEDDFMGGLTVSSFRFG